MCGPGAATWQTKSAEKLGEIVTSFGWLLSSACCSSWNPLFAVGLSFQNLGALCAGKLLGWVMENSKFIQMPGSAPNNEAGGLWFWKQAWGHQQ